MIYFTADTHFNHYKIIQYNQRPFPSAEEMNEGLIQNWNQNIKPNDIVYHLGDFGFGKLNSIFDRLKGKIILIEGSHDRDTIKRYRNRFLAIYPVYRLILNKQKEIFLNHYAQRFWPRSHYNMWHLFGHCHGHAESWGKSFDVGVDAHEFKPWSLEEVVQKMETLPDNFNLVKR